MRTVLSLVLLAALLWASCTVKLGRFTLAEHVDRIGETEEAKALLAGTRGKIAPVLEDMKQRIFGEYVEAPTAPPKSAARKTERVAGTGRAEPARSARPQEAERAGPASPDGKRKTASAGEATLPGRSSPAKAVVGASSEATGSQAPRKTPSTSSKPAGVTRAPSTSEAARLPGARRPASP